jgi:hypothetical protein
MVKNKKEQPNQPNISSIKINIIINETKEESKPIELTRNMIYHPSIISKPVSHSKYPFICDNIEYSAEMFKNGQSPEQIVDFFFNRKTFKTNLSLLKTQESTDSDTDVKKKTLEKNIMFMLQHLFPTKYPNIAKLNHSYKNIKKDTPLIATGNVGYSYLDMNGSKYTVTSVVWLNDILNHPNYNELMVFMYEYIVWAFGENETIKKDIESNEDKMIDVFLNGLDTDIRGKIIATLETNAADNNSNNSDTQFILDLLNKKDTIKGNAKTDIQDIGRLIEIQKSSQRNQNYYKKQYEIKEPEYIRWVEDLKVVYDEIIGLQKFERKYLKNCKGKSDFDCVRFWYDDKDKEWQENERFDTFKTTMEKYKEFKKNNSSNVNEKLQTLIDNFVNNIDKDNTGKIKFPTLVKHAYKIIQDDHVIGKGEKKEKINQDDYFKIGPNSKKMKGTKLFEIYVAMDVIKGEVNKSNENSRVLECAYGDDHVVDLFNKMIKADTTGWKISRMPFVSIEGTVEKNPTKKGESFAPDAMKTLNSNDKPETTPVQPTQRIVGGYTRKNRNRRNSNSTRRK